ncbi:MAG: hypothetical protein IJH03_05765 [Clostridia bacterium]|nr:hypothetical protein [Clostridia bacterium]
MEGSQGRDYGEIYRYQEQFGLTADITGLSASDWDIYIGTIIDLLNKYSDVDTETWLALLTAQQSSQVVDGQKATAVGVDRTGDGVEDAYRVTIPAPLNLVRDVYTRLSFELAGDEDDEEWEFFKMFLGLPDTIDIAKVHGNPVQEEIVNYLSWGADLGSGVRSLFAGTDCAYEFQRPGLLLQHHLRFRRLCDLRGQEVLWLGQREHHKGDELREQPDGEGLGAPADGG